MLYAKFRHQRTCSSQRLTIAIVGTVILVNAFGWGVPALLANVADPADVMRARLLENGAQSLKDRRQPPPEGPQAANGIPLPIPAPTRQPEPYRLTAGQNFADGPRAPAKPPPTLRPRPETPPDFPIATSKQALKPGRDNRAQMRPPLLPKALIAVRALALKAAERVAEMRQHMVRLDAGYVRPYGAASTAHRTLLPIAARAPDAHEGPLAATDERQPVRPRLQRRPIRPSKKQDQEWGQEWAQKRNQKRD